MGGHGCFDVGYDESVEFWIVLAFALDDDTVRSFDSVELVRIVDFGRVFDLKLKFASVIFKLVSVIVGEDGLIVMVLGEEFGLKGSDSFVLDSFEKSNNLSGFLVVIEIFDSFTFIELEGLLKGF
jgi:hypothetical protein